MAVPTLGNIQRQDEIGGDPVVTKPTGLSIGDTILLYVSSQISNPGAMPWFTWPTGFTEINQVGNNSTDCVVAAAYRVVDGTEGANFTIGNDSAGADVTAFAVAIHGAHATAPLDVTGTGVTGWLSLNLVVPSVTTTVDDCLAFYVMCADGADVGPYDTPSGWTEQTDWTNGSAIGGVYGYKSMATAGATGTATIVNNGVDDQGGAFQFAFAPAAASGLTLEPVGLAVSIALGTAAFSHVTPQSSTPGSLNVTIALGVPTYVRTQLLATVGLPVIVAIGNSTGDNVTPQDILPVGFGILPVIGLPVLEEAGKPIALAIPAQFSAVDDVISLDMSVYFTDPGTLTYTASGLPPGLSIHPTTGLITGTILAD